MCKKVIRKMFEKMGLYGKLYPLKLLRTENLHKGN